MPRHGPVVFIGHEGMTDSDKWPKLSKFLDPDWRHRQLKRTPAREQPNTRTITDPAAGVGPAGPSGSLIQRCKLRSRHFWPMFTAARFRGLPAKTVAIGLRSEIQISLRRSETRSIHSTQRWWSVSTRQQMLRRCQHCRSHPPMGHDLYFAPEQQVVPYVAPAAASAIVAVRKHPPILLAQQLRSAIQKIKAAPGSHQVLVTLTEEPKRAAPKRLRQLFQGKSRQLTHDDLLGLAIASDDAALGSAAASVKSRRLAELLRSTCLDELARAALGRMQSTLCRMQMLKYRRLSCTSGCFRLRPVSLQLSHLPSQWILRARVCKRIHRVSLPHHVHVKPALAPGSGAI